MFEIYRLIMMRSSDVEHVKHVNYLGGGVVKVAVGFAMLSRRDNIILVLFLLLDAT